MSKRSWRKPSTWFRRDMPKAAGELSASAVDPFYVDESRTAQARATSVAPEAIWRDRGAALRDRARNATARDPHAWSLVDKLAGNIIYTGIRVQPASKSSTRNERLSAAFRAWSARAWVGRWTLDAGAEQAAWALVETGEVLAVRQWRPDLLPGVPMRLKLVEADLIDADLPDVLRPDGSKRVDGIELDMHGEPSGYWLLPEHPKSGIGLANTGARRSSLVSADDVIHLFRPLRPGQQRGVTWLAPVLDDLGELDDYEGAEGTRKALDSCIMGFAEMPASEALPPSATAQDKHALKLPGAVTDAYGNPVGGLMQGAIVNVPPGGKVTMHSPAPSQGYEEYKRSKLRSSASGVGVMYEQASGDLSTVNYSSYRAGHIEFRRRVNSIRKNIVIPRLYERIWEWWVEAAFVAGVSDLSAVEATFTAPRWESVDPQKDAQADVTEVEAGFALEEDKIAERGKDPSAFLAAKAEWEKQKAAKLGPPAAPEPAGGKSTP